MACEKIRDVDRSVEAGGCAAGNQASADCEAADAVVPCGLADVLEDHFHAAAIGQALHFVGNFLRGVIDHGIGTQLPGLFEFCVGAGGGDHARPGGFRDLNCSATHAAACAEHQHGFRGLQFCASDEHVPGGE